MKRTPPYDRLICGGKGGLSVALLRIDKILSSQNIASRSEIKTFIKQGRIKADGRTVLRAEEKLDPELCEIRLDDRPLVYKRFIYIMLNKPKGVLSASRDSREKTVLELLPPELKRKKLSPVGRLDKNTEGLLIISDDGNFSHRLLAPKSHVSKLYKATVDRKLNETDIKSFAAGISEGGDDFLPARMKLIDENTALVEIQEGKYHQIKRMFHAVGTEVLELKRLQIGKLELDEGLSPGEARELSPEEIKDALSRDKILV